jgi:hypothetical protein
MWAPILATTLPQPDSLSHAIARRRRGCSPRPAVALSPPSARMRSVAQAIARRRPATTINAIVVQLSQSSHAPKVACDTSGMALGERAAAFWVKASASSAPTTAAASGSYMRTSQASPHAWP